MRAKFESQKLGKVTFLPGKSLPLKFIFDRIAELADDETQLKQEIDEALDEIDQVRIKYLNLQCLQKK